MLWQLKKGLGVRGSGFGIFALTLILSLTNCGFSPVYGTGERVQLSGVRIEPIPGRNGQLLHTALEDQLNPEAAEAPVSYTLHAEIIVNSVPLILREDGTVARYRVDFTAPFSLKDEQTGRVMLSDTMKRSLSYTISEADYATYVTAEDAVERGILELSHDMTQRIAAFMNQQ